MSPMTTSKKRRLSDVPNNEIVPLSEIDLSPLCRDPIEKNVPRQNPRPVSDWPPFWIVAQNDLDWLLCKFWWLLAIGAVCLCIYLEDYDPYVSGKKEVTRRATEAVGKMKDWNH